MLRNSLIKALFTAPGVIEEQMIQMGCTYDWTCKANKGIPAETAGREEKQPQVQRQDDAAKLDGDRRVQRGCNQLHCNGLVGFWRSLDHVGIVDICFDGVEAGGGLPRARRCSSGPGAGHLCCSGSLWVQFQVRSLFPSPQNGSLKVLATNT